LATDGRIKHASLNIASSDVWGRIDAIFRHCFGAGVIREERRIKAKMDGHWSAAAERHIPVGIVLRKTVCTEK